MNATQSASLSPTVLARIAAVLGLLAVALGAMGAHALKDVLASTTNGLDQWKTAAHYHLVHAVVLYFLADKGRTAAWWLMFAGILGFSGSLYLYAVTHVKFLVAITPFGGVLLMIGWGLLAFCGGRKKA